MKSSTMTPDGYVVGSDGAWIEPLGKSGDQAVSPWFYQSMLGKGLDVTWSEFPKQTASYSEQMVKDFKAAGVSMSGSALKMIFLLNFSPLWISRSMTA